MFNTFIKRRKKTINEIIMHFKAVNLKKMFLIKINEILFRNAHKYLKQSLQNHFKYNAMMVI